MSVFTAANQLTLLRLLLVPFFVLFMLYGMPGWALTTFTVAAVTDALDGQLARSLNQPTTLGAWLDPMADKILIATMFVMLTVPGLGMAVRLPLWLTVMVLSRDIAIILTVAIVNLAVAPRTFRPTLLGKAATALYLTTGVAALVTNYTGRYAEFVDACIWASLVITVASALQYTWLLSRGVKPAPPGSPSSS